MKQTVLLIVGLGIGALVLLCATPVVLAQEFVPIKQIIVPETSSSSEVNIPQEKQTEKVSLPATEIEKLKQEIETMQEPPIVFVPAEQKKKRYILFRWFFAFTDWLRREPPIKKGSKTQKLRENWEDMLGTDVFYLYFKAKEAQETIKEKYSYEVLDMKMSPDYRDGKVWLKWKRKF